MPATKQQAAKRGAAKFLLVKVDETWYTDLKDADIFYTKVIAIKIMAFLDANSRGLHAIDMITLQMNMHGYYAQANGIPQYIIMLEEAQKKAKQAGMPITNIELVMMPSAAVLAAMHFPRKVDKWEGLPTLGRTWGAWKTSFRSAHLKRQCQILASGEASRSGGCTVFFPRIHRQRSIAWRLHSTTWRLRRPTTPLCCSNSRWPTWR